MAGDLILRFQKPSDLGRFWPGDFDNTGRLRSDRAHVALPVVLSNATVLSTIGSDGKEYVLLGRFTGLCPTGKKPRVTSQRDAQAQGLFIVRSIYHQFDKRLPREEAESQCVGFVCLDDIAVEEPKNQKQKAAAVIDHTVDGTPSSNPALQRVKRYNLAISSGVCIGIIISGVIIINSWPLMYLVGSGFIGVLLLLIFFASPESAGS